MVNSSPMMTCIIGAHRGQEGYDERLSRYFQRNRSAVGPLSMLIRDKSMP